MDTPTTTPTPAVTSDKNEPKKYIRTYAGDMEALKKGWTPNLTPLKERPPSPPAPIPAQPPPPAPQPPIPAQAPAPAQQPTEWLRLDRGPSPIQTYASDFSQRVKQTHASTATVLAAEQDAASGAPQTAPVESSRGGIISVVAGIVLLLLGAVGAYVAYTRYLVKVAPVALAPTSSTPIFVDDREEIISETPTATRQAIQQSVARALAPNTVRLLYTDFATTTGGSVFSALELPAPGSLLRNVNPSRSIAGVIHAGGVQSPFFILSVASYGDTFAGMLSWESTMPRDLGALFPSYPQPTSTTTMATSTPIFTVFFHDEVVSNHDARVYRDAEGRSILIYGYWNQTTLVIARDPSAFAELLERLATSRAQN